jgi:hypothetical protein
MAKAGSLLLGFLTGAIVVSAVIYFIFLKSTNKYVEIKSDYFIENGGIIKKGTVLKIDQPFSEGFTRYVLYLNLSDGEIVEKHEEPRTDVVVPYWLQSDTLKTE